MALIRCKQCQKQMTIGFMPTASCGLLLIPGVVIAGVSIVAGWRHLHWWALLLPVPVFFLTVLAVHFIPYTIEWLTAFLYRWPQCGSRRWSYPYTRGFGL